MAKQRGLWKQKPKEWPKTWPGRTPFTTGLGHDISGRVRHPKSYLQGMSHPARMHYYSNRRIHVARRKAGFIAAGVGVGAGASLYAAHKYHQRRRTRRNYKGQFAGSY